MRKGWKRVHRLVTLPEYQGIGIGTAFIDKIATIYLESGFNFNLTTTTPALRFALLKNNKWILKRQGRAKNTFSKMKDCEHLTRSSSQNRITYSFDYKGVERG